MQQGPHRKRKCSRATKRLHSAQGVRRAYLERTLLLVLFNMNKRVDDAVDDLLVGVLTTTITAGGGAEGFNAFLHAEMTKPG